MLRCCNLKVFKIDLTQHLADLMHTMGKFYLSSFSPSQSPLSLLHVRVYIFRPLMMINDHIVFLLYMYYGRQIDDRLNDIHPCTNMHGVCAIFHWLCQCCYCLLLSICVELLEEEGLTEGEGVDQALLYNDVRMCLCENLEGSSSTTNPNPRGNDPSVLACSGTPVYR